MNFSSPRFLRTYSIFVLLKTLQDVLGIKMSFSPGANCSIICASGDPLGTRKPDSL